MPGISMCKGENCPIKEYCYRFKATPNQFAQAYFTEPPIKDNNCNYFWPENDINAQEGAKILEQLKAKE